MAKPTPPGPRCPGCGYDIFGLRDMRCPECGRPLTIGDFSLSDDDSPRHERRDTIIGIGVCVLIAVALGCGELKAGAPARGS